MQINEKSVKKFVLALPAETPHRLQLVLPPTISVLPDHLQSDILHYLLKFEEHNMLGIGDSFKLKKQDHKIKKILIDKA